MEDNIQIINDVLTKMVEFIQYESCLIKDIYTGIYHSIQINNDIINNYLNDIKNDSFSNNIKPVCSETVQNVTVSSLNKNMCKKNVSFNEICEMYFIPNRSEIFEESLKDDIWWNGMEFLNFRNQATSELRKFILDNPSANYKKYSKTLWLELDFDAIYEYYDKTHS
jgi:hypothetical protein